MTKTDRAGASKLRGWQTSAVFSCFFEVYPGHPIDIDTALDPRLHEVVSV